MSLKLKTILSIAGSDPTGGAGIQADIRTGISLGFHMMTAVTAVTAQSSKGLREIGSISPFLLNQQLKCVLEDALPNAVKIGIVGSYENIYVISEFLKNLPSDIPVVIDPVSSASADHQLLVEDSTERTLANLYIEKLFPYATLITPNYKEILWLTGLKNLDRIKLNEIKDELNVSSLVVTYGDEEDLTDILCHQNKIYSNSHKRIECKNLHGTGCVYSTLMACQLALGKDLLEAFNFVNSKMEEIIYNSIDYNFGSSNYGPLNINNYRL